MEGSEQEADSIKIGYIFISLGPIETSVSKKVTGQIKFLNGLEGVECTGLFFSCFYEKNEDEGFIKQIQVPKSDKKYFNHLRQNELNYKIILEFLQTHKNEYTHFYLRHNSSSKNLWKIVQLKLNLTIEINGNLPATIPKDKKKLTSVSDFLHNLAFYYLPLRNERVYGTKIFNHCRISSTSGELYQLFKSFYQIKKDRFFVVGNGINLESIPVREFSKTNEVFKMLILKGAEIKADYLGLDRVLNGLAQYDGSEGQVELVCAGKHFDDEKVLVKNLGIESRVKFVGYLDRNQMGQIVSECDIAISSLATYRSGIKEISSLKTREYFGRGIPFLYGYDDTDLMKIPESHDFALKVSNESSPVDIKNVISFFGKIVESPDHPEKMREIAEKYLAMDKKMLNLAEELRKPYV
ncbi:MAG: hypothetical protein R2799_09750 [Crocinitomicaceae bacterium]